MELNRTNQLRSVLIMLIIGRKHKRNILILGILKRDIVTINAYENTCISYIVVRMQEVYSPNFEMLQRSSISERQ